MRDTIEELQGGLREIWRDGRCKYVREFDMVYNALSELRNKRELMQRIQGHLYHKQDCPYIKLKEFNGDCQCDLLSLLMDTDVEEL